MEETRPRGERAVLDALQDGRAMPVDALASEAGYSRSYVRRILRSLQQRAIVDRDLDGHWYLRDPVDALVPAEVGEVESLLGQLRLAYESGELAFTNPGLEAEFLAQTDTVAAQLRSPRPRREVVLSALYALDAEVGELLRWGAYGALGQALFEVIKRLAHG